MASKQCLEEIYLESNTTSKYLKFAVSIWNELQKSTTYLLSLGSLDTGQLIKIEAR